MSGPIQAALSWCDLELVFSLPLFPALTRPLGRGGDSCSFLPFSTAYLFRAALPSNPATFWAWELVLPPGLVLGTAQAAFPGWVGPLPRGLAIGSLLSGLARQGLQLWVPVLLKGAPLPHPQPSSIVRLPTVPPCTPNLPFNWSHWGSEKWNRKSAATCNVHHPPPPPYSLHKEKAARPPPTTSLLLPEKQEQSLREGSSPGSSSTISCPLEIFHEQRREPVKGALKATPVPGTGDNKVRGWGSPAVPSPTLPLCFHWPPGGFLSPMKSCLPQDLCSCHSSACSVLTSNSTIASSLSCVSLKIAPPQRGLLQEPWLG